ncbi:MAG: hypothetical protein K2L42_02410 [Clostridia bacterium]|nr:hypothetical protein [Clostridia bacterium]
MKELIFGTTAYKIFCGDCEAGKISHAYMLNFPDVKNLKSALMLFALKFFGAQENSPLGARILNGSYSDLKVYPADDKKLTAEAVSEILDDCAMRPVEGRKKLYVISGFDTASALLQNKLLKTLEEPLEGVHFLLGACSLAPVLDTVKSRVRILEIAPFTEVQIFAALERQAHREINASAAKSANGILGVAENMALGGWFGEILKAAKEICSVTRVGEIGAVAAKYGDTKYKNELLCEMQRLYFAALGGKESLPLLQPALIYAIESLNGAFADLKFNAFFQGLLYGFMLGVVEENEKWQKLSE